MKPKVFRQIRGDRYIEVLPALGMYMDDYSCDPHSLWELLAYLEVMSPQDRRLIAAVYERARKYEPGGRVTEADKARHTSYLQMKIAC